LDLSDSEISDSYVGSLHDLHLGYAGLWGCHLVFVTSFLCSQRFQVTVGGVIVQSLE